MKVKSHIFAEDKTQNVDFVVLYRNPDSDYKCNEFRVLTGTGKPGKPGKMGEHFPVREKSGNFVHTEKSAGIFFMEND